MRVETRWKPAPPHLGRPYQLGEGEGEDVDTSVVMLLGGATGVYVSMNTSDPIKTVALVGGVGLLGWGILRLLSFGGLGGNAGTPGAVEVGRPLEVTIEGETYLVDGEETSLEALLELAQTVPPGDGPAVVVTLMESSRARAETILKNALDEKGISVKLNVGF